MGTRIALYTFALASLPAPALAAGTLLHVVDFEPAGDFSPGTTYSQVDTNIDTCEYEKSCTTDSLAIVESPEPVRSGKRALRVSFAKGDQQSTSGNRAELKLAKQFAHEYDVSFWYGFSVLIPNEWQFASSDHSNVFQIHAGSGPGSSPVVGIRVGNAGAWRITTERDGTPSNQKTDTLAEFPVQKGIWNDFVMHAIWSSQDDGVLEIWHNGSKVVDKQAWRTIHPDTEAQKPTSSFYVKFGYYGLDVSRVLYHDELRVAKGTGDLSDLVAPAGSSAPDGGAPKDAGSDAEAGGAGATSGGAGGANSGGGGTGGDAGGTTGGATGVGGTGSPSGGAGASAPDDAGCGCRAVGRDRGHVSHVLLLLAAALAARRLRPRRTGACVRTAVPKCCQHEP